MSTRSLSWILPSNFMCRDDGPFVFDLKDCLAVLTANRVWNRKLSYENGYVVPENVWKKVRNAQIIVYPAGREYYYVQNAHELLFTQLFGEIPAEFKYIYERGNLRVSKALTIIKLEYDGFGTISHNLSAHEELDIEKALDFDEHFQEESLNLLSLCHELAALFMMAVHLTFPTRDHDISSKPSQSSGLALFQERDLKYYLDYHSYVLASPSLVEKKRFEDLIQNLESLSKIWHKDIWTFQRFLSACRSTQITVDNLMDLMFCLESLFDKKASSESIRIIASLLSSVRYADCHKTDEMIQVAFQIRNDVAHNAVDYRMVDKAPGKPYWIMEVFWHLKVIVINLIVFAAAKLLSSKQGNENRLRISIDDIYHLHFKSS